MKLQMACHHKLFVVVILTIVNLSGQADESSRKLESAPSIQIQPNLDLPSLPTELPIAAQPIQIPPKLECDEPIEVKDGKPLVPTDATEIEPEIDVDEDRGLVSALYPTSNTTTDQFYPLPCEPSIGGTLPPDEQPSQDELDVDAYLYNFEKVEGPKIIREMHVNQLPAPSEIAPIKRKQQCMILHAPPTPPTLLPCDSKEFLLNDQPFGGRDIIYVHGLATEHIIKNILNPFPLVHPAQKLWPDDASEFLDSGKYFRNYAEHYWEHHLREHLFDPVTPTSSIAGWEFRTGSNPIYKPKSNRYLLVAWSSSQTIEYAQHALLTQIQLAIATNKNVVTPPTFPSKHSKPFCFNGCIIISHSTGGLVTSTAMSRANSGYYGLGGKFIASKIVAHVGFASALSGSTIGTIGMALGTAANTLQHPSTVVKNLLCPVLDDIFGMTNMCNSNFNFVANSILRDLMPIVAQREWGPIVNSSPIPTLLIAGGHPIGDYALTSTLSTKFLIPGLDDGVVSMNSACGNPNSVFPTALAPSGFTVILPHKAFDFSNNSGRLLRATKNLLSHKDLKALPPAAKYFAGACTPHLSPTGMVMPVQNSFSGSAWDARRRYNNHFSFIQGVIDHSYDGGGILSNRWPSQLQQPASTDRKYRQYFTTNNEESSAITNSAIYQQIDANGTYLVHPSFANMHEIVRGRKISFKLFGKRRTKWIWKRTYHLLDKWEQKQSSHYVYEFVSRR